jgi:hypothetical protein
LPKRILPVSYIPCRLSKYSPDGGNRLRDGGGLYLELLPSRAKKWRLDYQKSGSKSENLLTFGDYPAVGLSAARERREEACAQIAEDTDPALPRDVARATVSDALRNTFRAVAEESLEHRNDTWSDGYAQKTKQLLERPLPGPRAAPDSIDHPRLPTCSGTQDRNAWRIRNAEMRPGNGRTNLPVRPRHGSRHN